MEADGIAEQVAYFDAAVRTPTQRRHDALHDMLADSLSSGERRTVGGERPHVIVVVDAETGQARTGSMIFLSMLEHPTLQSLFANEERSWPETSSAGFLAARTTQDGQTFTTSRTDVTAGPTNSAIWC